MKPGYTDHGLVGADDDTFAFEPGKIAGTNKTAQPPVPVIKTAHTCPRYKDHRGDGPSGKTLAPTARDQGQFRSGDVASPAD